jgi:hypothetical protein
VDGRSPQGDRQSQTQAVQQGRLTKALTSISAEIIE